jgi:hypothetical protein
VLLELKQQLVSAQSINGNVNDEASAATSNGLQELNPEVARLEAEIAKQVCMIRMSSRVEQNVVRHLWFRNCRLSDQGQSELKI